MTCERGCFGESCTQVGEVWRNHRLEHAKPNRRIHWSMCPTFYPKNQNIHAESNIPNSPKTADNFTENRTPNLPRKTTKCPTLYRLNDEIYFVRVHAQAEHRHVAMEPTKILHECASIFMLWPKNSSNASSTR
jgi:hypothetical protein